MKSYLFHSTKTSQTPHIPLFILSVCRRAVLISGGDFPNSSAASSVFPTSHLVWKDCPGYWGGEGLCIHGGHGIQWETPLSGAQAALEQVEGIS